MPIPVQCPNCSAKLNAPDGAAGKRVKCPKCQTVLEVPVAAEHEEAESEPTPRPSKRRPPADEDDRPSRRQRAAEDEDERPSKRSRRDEEEEEDDRPRRSRRDDEDEDERPSRRRSSRRDDDEDEDEDDDRRSRRGDSRKASGAKKFNVCGLISLITGIISILVNVFHFFTCCCPLAGWIPSTLSILAGGVSLGLGITGLVQAKKSGGQMSGGLAIAGTILGGVAVVFSVVFILFLATLFGVTAAAGAALPTVPTNYNSPPTNNNPFGPGRRPPTDGGVNDDPVTAADPVGATLTAANFADEFRTNPTTANAKYLGKIVELTGVIDEVSRADFGDSDLTLKGQPSYRVTCVFGPRKAALLGLRSGGTVTVRGWYVGHTAGQPKLTSCIVMPGQGGR